MIILKYISKSKKQNHSFFFTERKKYYIMSNHVSTYLLILWTFKFTKKIINLFNSLENYITFIQLQNNNATT